MNAAVVLIAVLLAGQVQPPERSQPETSPPAKQSAEKTNGKPAKEADPNEADPKADQQPVFTLDQIAAGAKNDAFVDEFLKDKTLKLYGRVEQIERWPTSGKAEGGYRVLMGRLSREDHAVDVEVLFMFPTSARKELALLEPGTSRITVEGTCAETQLQTLPNGLGFTLAVKDCKLVETPTELEAGNTPPRTTLLPVVTPNGVQPVAPMPGTGPIPPPTPQQPMPLPPLPPRSTP
jgi:hypothetical protein